MSRSLEKIFHSCITWNIFNYFNGLTEVNTPIESPEFVTDLHEPIKWKLALIGRREYEGKYLTECILKRSPSCCRPKQVPVKVRLALINSNGCVWDDSTQKASFYPNTAISFRSSDIYDTTKNSVTAASFYSGNVIVKCDILLDIPLHFRQSDMDPHLKALSNDLRYLRMAGNFTDLDLKVGDRNFFVHRAIVKSRSLHIAEILNENPCLRQIDLTDVCNIPLVRGLVDYWYSGNLDKIPQAPSLTTSTCIQNLKQHELRPYVDPEVIKISTTFKTLSRSISWVIDDFQFCECLNHLERLIYYVYTIQDLSWKLYFYPKGIGGDSDFISLCIIKEHDVSVIPGYLEVFLTDENGTEYGAKTTINWSRAPRIYEFPKFMTHYEFVSLRENLLKHNTLRIGCRITYGTNYANCNIQTVAASNVYALDKVHPYINLANEMKRLWQSEDMSDISLKSGDKIFRVHSAILAARSRYFEYILMKRKNNLSQTEVIILEDIDPENLDIILKYMYYAEKIELNPKRAVTLYPVFRKYKITCLETLCLDYLQCHENAKNKFNGKDLPDSIKSLSLKRCARQVIHKNLDNISKTERWRKLLKDNDKLAAYILSENLT